MGLFLDKEQGIFQHFQNSLTGIRTGRITASILDSILVEAYGTQMHIKELATVSSPESTQLMITPFDKTVLSAIEKALVAANLGAQPINDGAGVRLSFPPLTEENRKARAKEVDKYLEEARIHIRQNRGDALRSIEKQKDDSEIGEDDAKRAEFELQKEVDDANKKLLEITEAKKVELLKM